MKDQRTFPPERVLVATDLGEASLAAMYVARYLHEHHGSEATSCTRTISSLRYISPPASCRR